MVGKRRATTKETVKSLYNYEWYRANKEKQRWYQVKLKYGLTKEEYDKLLEEQKNCCAICDRHVLECSQPLYVDHCHDTGKIRGLLCAGCNGGIGLMNDDVEVVRKAVKYLESYL